MNFDINNPISTNPDSRMKFLANEVCCNVLLKSRLKSYLDESYPNGTDYDTRFFAILERLQESMRAAFTDDNYLIKKIGNKEIIIKRADQYTNRNKNKITKALETLGYKDSNPCSGIQTNNYISSATNPDLKLMSYCTLL